MTTTLSVPTELRHATLTELADALRQQATVRYDAVVPAQRLAYERGLFVIRDGAVRLGVDGVDLADMRFVPSRTGEAHVAEHTGGVANAMTAAAQVWPDADEAARMSESALDAMEMAARL